MRLEPQDGLGPCAPAIPGLSSRALRVTALVGGVAGPHSPD